MTLNERLFIIVPLLSLLCNLFLFLTALSTKKDRLVYAFIALLGAFTMWSGGSLFMRLQLAPGSPFWYMVSITGIFLVPFLVYNFIYRFTATKAPFSHIVQGAVWLVILLLNAGNIFITNPHMVTVGHETRFEYGVSPLVIIPILRCTPCWRPGAWPTRAAGTAVRILPSSGPCWWAWGSCLPVPYRRCCPRWSPCRWTPSPAW